MGRVTSVADQMNRVRAKRGETPEDIDYENASRSRRTIPVQLDDIRVEDRLRTVDPAAVEHLAESIDRQGLQSPILVRRADDGSYVLVAGAHRIAAARLLSWTQIEAFEVKDLPEDEIVFLEIDENFCRAELKPLDRGRFMSKRKELYQRLYPETRHGGDRKSLTYKDNINAQALRDDEPTKSFANHTAAHTPFSPRTIERAVRIGDNILPALQEALASTPLADREGDLYRIAGMTADEQQGLLGRIRGAEEPPPTLAALMKGSREPRPSSSPAPDRLDSLWSRTPEDRRSRFLKRVLTEAAPAKRAEFREWLQEAETNQ